MSIERQRRILNIKKQIQVNIPYSMLVEGYLERFIGEGLNPEIGLDAKTLDRYSPEDFQKVSNIIHENGLRITLHGPYVDLSPGSPDPEIRAVVHKRFEQIVGVISIFKPVSVVFHTGWDGKRYNYIRESYLSESAKIWRWLALEIRKKGSILVLENVFEDAPEELMDIYLQVKDYGVGLCFDAGHMMAFGNKDLSGWLRVIGQDIFQLHLHDNMGTADDHYGMGMGKIDFGLLFEYLKSREGSKPIITLEPHRDEDLWGSLEYLESAWPW